jgi:hypothetical protein
MSITATATAPSVVMPNQPATINVTITSTGSSTLSQAKLSIPNGITAAVSACYQPGQAIAASTNVIPFQVTFFDQNSALEVVRINGEFLLADGSACNLNTDLFVKLQPSPQAVPPPPDASFMLFDRIYQDDSQQLALGHLAWLF